jgi:hypothetical protein
MLARITGFEAASRAMERLAASAERAADILDQLDARRLERLSLSADRAADILDRIDADRLDRLAAAAERAAAMLDRLEKEISVEGAKATMDSINRLSENTSEMAARIRAIEVLAGELRTRISDPVGSLMGRLTRPPERPRPAERGREAPRRRTPP